MFKRKKFVIGGLLVLAAIGVLGYMGFQSSATYYYTVSEVLDKGSAVYDKDLRVAGKVVDGSISQQAAGSRLQFAITDGQEDFPVTYQGAVPDAFFQPDADVVVEGRMDQGGVFEARSLVAKCPAKYVPQG